MQQHLLILVLPKDNFSPESGGRVKPRTAMEAMRRQGTIRLQKQYIVLLLILIVKVISRQGSGQQSQITSFLLAGTPCRKIMENYDLMLDVGKKLFQKHTVISKLHQSLKKVCYNNHKSNRMEFSGAFLDQKDRTIKK